MKTLAMVLLLLSPVLLATPAAHGIVDPCPNNMSIYFDTTADSFMYYFTSPYFSLPMYVILTNPDFGALTGYEFGYELVGYATVSSISFAGQEPIDTSSTEANHIVRLTEPLPTSEATILATLNVIVLGVSPTLVRLRGAEPSSLTDSLLPAVILPNGDLLSIGVAAWDATTGEPAVCAGLNCFITLPSLSDCILSVGTESVTWDAVKSMYR